MGVVRTSSRWVSAVGQIAQMVRRLKTKEEAANRAAFPAFTTAVPSAPRCVRQCGSDEAVAPFNRSRPQIRAAGEDPEGPHALRIHPQMLDFPATTIQI
jgi:hypothetical protein